MKIFLTKCCEKMVFSQKSKPTVLRIVMKPLIFKGKLPLVGYLCKMLNNIYHMWKTTIDFVKTWCYDEVAERKKISNPSKS